MGNIIDGKSMAANIISRLTEIIKEAGLNTNSNCIPKKMKLVIITILTLIHM